MKQALLLIFLSAIILTVPLGSTAKNLGVFGTVYDISEKDALKEMQEKASKADISKIINKKEVTKRIKNYTPDDIAELKNIEPARKDKTFLVDMTYTLEMDLTDGNGNIIYPRGYTFNPLDYMVYPDTLVILDGKSPKQLAWFKASTLKNDLKVTLLITDGSYSDLSETLKRPVFYANKSIINVFRIEAVPSIVRQKGDMMEVTEVAVSEWKPSEKKPPVP